MTRPLQVYVSFADADKKKYRDKLFVFLKPFINDGKLVWCDRVNPPAGYELADLKSLAEAADIFIALISPDYLANDFCTKELTRALERRENNSVEFWWVQVQTTPLPELGDSSSAFPTLVRRFAAYKGLPSGDKAISELKDRNKAWLEVAAQVRSSVDRQLASKADSRNLKVPGNLKSSAALGEVRNRFALVVGINDYPAGAGRPLLYAANDAIAISKTLTALPKPYVVTSLHDSDSQKDQRLTPNRTNIQLALDVICKNAGPNDLIFAHFSCHGVTAAGTNEPILVVGDSRSESFETTGIPLKSIEAMLRESRARRIVLSLDSCHSGVLLKRDTRDPGATDSRDSAEAQAARTLDFYRNAYDLAEGFAILAACSREGVAYEDFDSKLGAYTALLIQALQGAADRPHAGARKNFVTINDVLTYLAAELPRWGVAHHKLQPQQPNLHAEVLGDLILADHR